MPITEEKPKLKLKLIPKNKTPHITFNYGNELSDDKAITYPSSAPRFIHIPAQSGRELYAQAHRTLYSMRSQVHKQQTNQPIMLKAVKSSIKYDQDDKWYATKNNGKIFNELGLIIYTDGGYSPSKNIGTWAYIIQVYNYSDEDKDRIIAHGKKNAKQTLPDQSVWEDNSTRLNTPNISDAIRDIEDSIGQKIEKHQIMNWVQSCDCGKVFNEKEDIYYSTDDRVLFMEMMAVIQALEFIKSQKHRLNIKAITILSDSKNMCEWKENMQHFSENDWYDNYHCCDVPEKMRRVWQIIKYLSEESHVEFIFVKGHVNIPFNEHVNEMCQLRRLLYNGMDQKLYNYYFTRI